MTEQQTALLAPAGVPEPNRVIVGRRGEPLSVRTEVTAPDTSLVANERVAVLKIPALVDFDRSVIPGRGQCSAVRTECKAGRRRSLLLQRSNLQVRDPQQMNSPVP